MNTVTNLLRHATALITGWRTRPVPRAAWHRADDLLMQAALLDEAATTDTWVWLAAEYEAWLEQERATAHTPSADLARMAG